MSTLSSVPTVKGSGPKRAFSAEAVRTDFPILQTRVRKDKPLVYLDNAASTQKPTAVIEAIDDYYRTTNANIHRAVHHLSEKATVAYDEARVKVQRFINAARPEEIVFTRGTTEAINLVASSFGGMFLKPGDSIVISAMEHHSNIVPWQLVAERTGSQLRVIPIDKRGVLNMDEARRLIADGPRIVAITHVSNALGTVNPIAELIEICHQDGVPILVDGAQSVQHLPIDVLSLNPDFYVFSGHKMYGPTGIGVLYGRHDLLQKMPPYQGGGDMIRTVTFEKSTWNDPPSKFEAGTPDIAGAIGLGVAVDYLSQFDMADIAAAEHDLLEYTLDKMRSINGVKLVGESPDRAGAISFVTESVHPHDLGTFLDRDGVAIRTGHHCAQPVMDFFDVPATARVSFGLYNTRNDVDVFCDSLANTIKLLS